MKRFRADEGSPRGEDLLTTLPSESGRVEYFVDLLIREDVPLAHDLENAFPTLQRLGSKLRGLVVADHWIQRRHRSDAGLEIVLADFGIGGDAFDAELPQRVRTVHEHLL